MAFFYGQVYGDAEGIVSRTADQDGRIWATVQSMKGSVQVHMYWNYLHTEIYVKIGTGVGSTPAMQNSILCDRPLRDFLNAKAF